LSIYRYPLSPPATGSSSVDNPTEMIDYVMFQRKRIQYDDSNGSSYYGLNIPNNNVAMEKNTDRVYINMPQNLSTQYQPTYRTVDMGVTGMAAASGLGSEGFDDLAKALQQAAKDAIPEFTAGAISEVASGAAQFLGLAGNATRNDIMALAKGKVFNPYQEQLFSNMQFRNHMFSFKFFARSERESQEINNIIKYLKQGALPIYGAVDGDAGAGNNASSRFFEIPDKFDIKFVRLDPLSGTLLTSSDLHYKIHTSVCTGIDVNYTPDGQYNAIGGRNIVSTGVGDNRPLQVPAVTVNCRFTETQLVMQSNITEGY